MSDINLFNELGTVGLSYMDFIKTLSKESNLEEKTHQLSYLSVLTALNMIDGLDFHVKELIKLNATRDEIKSAVLVAMPAIGMQIAPVLKQTLDIYDQNITF
ncbi:carboxymuconolactone decarboxylase family protein [Enterococcus avium]|uniref:carboxymuconolactone decarboxylase family protein n=1 Tax=Enterococcus avium TaxID=33945 RepID=UPI0032E4D7F0